MSNSLQKIMDERASMLPSEVEPKVLNTVKSYNLLGDLSNHFALHFIDIAVRFFSGDIDPMPMTQRGDDDSIWWRTPPVP